MRHLTAFEVRDYRMPGGKVHRFDHGVGGPRVLRWLLRDAGKRGQTVTKHARSRDLRDTYVIAYEDGSCTLVRFIRTSFPFYTISA